MDYTNTLPQVAEGANAVLAINEAHAAASPAMVYARDAGGSSGLVWAWLGGRWGGTLVPGFFATLTASTTSYMVVDRADGAVSISTTDTNWLDTTNYCRAYLIETGVSSVTGYEDHRAGPGGTQGAGGGGGGAGSDALDIIYDPTTSGLTSTDVQAAIDELAADLGAAGSFTSVVAGNGITVDATDADNPVVSAKPQSIIIACSDETTPLTVGTAKVTFRMPYAFTLTSVKSSVTTAPTDATLTVDINESGASILSTKLTIDSTEKTSATAATAAVISDLSLAADAEITIDIDQVGSTVAGAGLKVVLIGHPT